MLFDTKSAVIATGEYCEPYIALGAHTISTCTYHLELTPKHFESCLPVVSMCLKWRCHEESDYVFGHGVLQARQVIFNVYN